MHDFPFTSISLNYNYAAKLHRDGNNAGPSLTRSLGVFNGGGLFYPVSDVSLASSFPAMRPLSLYPLADFGGSRGLRLYRSNCKNVFFHFKLVLPRFLALSLP